MKKKGNGMKKQVQTRVLAYKMAKEISEEELKNVSGGGNNTSCGTCTQPTGNGGPVTWDVVGDIKLDW